LKAQVLDIILFLFFKTPGVVNCPSLKPNLMEKIDIDNDNDNVCKYDVAPSQATDPSSFDEIIYHLLFLIIIHTSIPSQNRCWIKQASK
jgi:hypothetical protein